MTLPWRFAMAALAAVTAASQFTDIATQAGITDVFYCGSNDAKRYIVESLGGGVALLDYDNDGWLDAFFVTGSRFEGFAGGRAPTNRLYRNNGRGGFEQVTERAGLAASGWGQGVCAGDFDNDGFTDLFVTYWGSNRLYRNRGDGSFADITRDAGLDRARRWGAGCAFLDYDRDGRLDLFVANYLAFDPVKVPLPGASPTCRWKGVPVLCGPVGLPGESNLLFHNEGGGRFRDVSVESGVAAVRDRYSLSATTLDFNHDGWPDIYVAVDSKPSILFRNNKDGTFTDVALEAGVAYSEDGREQSGMGSAAGDFDGDGRLDLVKTNFIDDTANLYRNLGDGAFEERVHASGMGRNTRFMGWGVGFLDYDNDGWPDIFMVNGHVYPEIEGKAPAQPYRQRPILYRNIGGKRMEDWSERLGVTALHSSRGAAFGDFDNDGAVDVFINNMNEQPSLLRNRGGGGNFVSLRLVGAKSNRSAIGARVTLTAGGRKQLREVQSGSSFFSHSDFRLHFGLGTAVRADRVEIEWPFGDLRDVVDNIEAGQFVTITEGKGVTSAR